MDTKFECERRRIEKSTQKLVEIDNNKHSLLFQRPYIGKVPIKDKESIVSNLVNISSPP